MTAAQPSLPHDELRALLKELDALPAFWGWNLDHPGGRRGLAEQLLPIILAQRQEAAKAELIKMRDEWGYANTVDSWEDYIEKRLAALQTYLEGEVKS